MAWFKVDDGFYSHAKVVRIPRTTRAVALGTWIVCGTWSADKLTDGFVPEHMLDELGGTQEGAKALVDVGLWRVKRDGFVFVNWSEFQPTREAIESTRKAERDRKAAYRASRQGKPGAGPGGVPSGQTRIPDTPYPTRPDPTHRETDVSLDVPADAVPPVSSSFAEFYMAYPRKVGKEAARRAFEKAAKSTPAGVIVAAAQRLAKDPNLPELQFIPHPATWLNHGRWDDDPLPPRAGAARPVQGPDAWLRDR